MSPMSQDRHLTWPHSGLLSLISRTKISTSVVAWNFPSEAITLRRYFSVSSLSRGFLEEIVHSPSIWLTVNCPSMSPSRRGQEARKKGIYWVLKIRSDKERGYRCVRCRSLRRAEGLAVVTQRGHWCQHPACFCYSLSAYYTGKRKWLLIAKISWYYSADVHIHCLKTTLSYLPKACQFFLVRVPKGIWELQIPCRHWLDLIVAVPCIVVPPFIL